MSKKPQYQAVATIWAEGKPVLPGELYTPASAAEAKRLIKAGALAEMPSTSPQAEPAPAPAPAPAPVPALVADPEPQQEQQAQPVVEPAPGLDLGDAAEPAQAEASTTA